jgi:hypothetical protein
MVPEGPLCIDYRTRRHPVSNDVWTIIFSFGRYVRPELLVHGLDRDFEPTGSSFPATSIVREDANRYASRVG